MPGLADADVADDEAFAASTWKAFTSQVKASA
jgi:hypothetical protein